MQEKFYYYTLSNTSSEKSSIIGSKKKKRGKRKMNNIFNTLEQLSSAKEDQGALNIANVHKILNYLGIQLATKRLSLVKLGKFSFSNCSQKKKQLSDIFTYYFKTFKHFI